MNVSGAAPVVAIRSLVSRVALQDCVLCIANELPLIAEPHRALRSL